MSANRLLHRGVLRGGGLSAMRLVRLVVLVALMALVGMMLWPVEPAGVVGSEADAGVYYEKTLHLEESLRRQRQVRVVIEESEINGYLQALMKHSESQGEQPSRTRLAPKDVNVSFTADHFVVHILAGWGPARLSYELTGRPADLSSTGFRIQVDRLRVGHVPMPVGVKDWLARRLLAVFDRLERERYILDRVGKFEMREHRMPLSTP